MVDVEYNDQQLTQPLLIVRANKYAPPLLGRAWMTKVRLDWKNLFSPSNGQFVVEPDNDERIVRLKQRYAEIFKPELGTCLLYTSPSPRDGLLSRMPSSA